MSYETRILLIEDDPSICALVTRYLSEDGYVVRSVASLRRALSALNNDVYDAAMIDLSLPDGDGLEAIRQLRREFPALKILAMSGMMNRAVARMCFTAGAAGVLAKPASPEAFRLSIYRLLDPSGSWIGAPFP